MSDVIEAMWALLTEAGLPVGWRLVILGLIISTATTFAAWVVFGDHR